MRAIHTRKSHISSCNMMFPPQMLFVNIEFAGIQKTGLEDENSEKEIDTGDWYLPNCNIKFPVRR